MDKKKWIITAVIYVCFMIFGIILGVLTSNNGIKFFPLGLIQAAIVSGIYLSIANRSSALPKVFVSGVTKFLSYFKSAFKMLVNTAEKTWNRVWILCIFIYPIYILIFIWITIAVFSFTVMVTILTALATCFVMPVLFETYTIDNPTTGVGVLSAVITLGVFAWHLLNMIFL